MTKSSCLQILLKAGFQNDYKGMQTSLDRLEIQQIHRLITHPKSSLHDLQFVLPAKASQASEIQKISIFINIILDIWPIIEMIQSWIAFSNYSTSSDQ